MSRQVHARRRHCHTVEHRSSDDGVWIAEQDPQIRILFYAAAITTTTAAIYFCQRRLTSKQVKYSIIIATTRAQSYTAHLRQHQIVENARFCNVEVHAALLIYYTYGSATGRDH